MVSQFEAASIVPIRSGESCCSGSIAANPPAEPQHQGMAPHDYPAVGMMNEEVKQAEAYSDDHESLSDVESDDGMGETTDTRVVCIHAPFNNHNTCTTTGATTATVSYEHLHSCKVCAKLPFKRSKGFLTDALLWDDAAAWDWDGGLYDLIRQMNGQEASCRIPEDLALETVQAATLHLGRLKEQLLGAGLQKHVDQNYTGESAHSARVIAPFDMSEIELGPILGTGGFSTVLEIAAFHPQQPKLERSGGGSAAENAAGVAGAVGLTSGINGAELRRTEHMSREYLTEHAQVHPGKALSKKQGEVAEGDADGKGRATANKKSKSCNVPYARYALKHLRNGLTTRSPDKFRRAAIDLVLEGQLLLVLDHPNIISIRGRSAQGPQAFLSGNPEDFFLVLDKLPVTLEDKMWEWRTKLIKYKKRWKRRTSRRKNSQLISSWVRKRLPGGRSASTTATTATHDDRGAEQQQLPDKYAVKIQKLLLERLRTAADIASAVSYMHAKGLIHRDLKTSNIGLDVLGSVKLFDLGLSRLLPSKGVTRSVGASGDMTESFVMSRVGTKFYMAPEVRRKDPYNTSADVYSFGVVLWELLSLATPRDMYHEEREKHHLAEKRKRHNNGAQQQAESKYATIKQKVKDGDGSWLPVCTCWPIGLQMLVKSALSNTASERPTIVEMEKELELHIEAIVRELHMLRFEQKDSSPTRRRSTFRLDLSNLRLDLAEDERSVDATDEALGEGSVSCDESASLAEVPSVVQASTSLPALGDTRPVALQ